MRILSVVGARPEFVQVAALCRALREKHEEILVHTGQHYDDQMSAVFFEELNLPRPDYNLGVGSGTHAQQTAAMLPKLEQIIVERSPDIVVIRGDTNSTLAAALAAAKCDLPIAHVEAGERSFNRAMPEEINRVVADRLSSIFFCVGARAVENLAKEGITKEVHLVGDVMYDTLRFSLPLARARSTLLARLGLTPKNYYLATLHRAENTDDPKRLAGIFEGIGSLDRQVVLPIHPRTAAAVKSFGVTVPPNVCVIEPLGYFDMLVAEENAASIATDSGGVQREAYCLSIPCVTLRDETEWTDTVDTGWNRLVGADPVAIRAGFAAAAARLPAVKPEIFGMGDAAEKLTRALEAFIARMAGTPWRELSGDR
jgi:UDP-N-acetylglucosamine 2-epimerase